MDIFYKLQPNEPVLLLAPMQGITTPVFREEVIKLGGVDLVATEFVRISHAKQNISSFKRHCVPLQIQLMAAETEILVQALKNFLNHQLIKTGDWLDLNAGCPAKRVNSHGAGAALLNSPEKLRKMIDAMRQFWTGPLSIKIRLGYNSINEFSTILQALKNAPLDFITIHAKTRQESTPLNQDSVPIHQECLALASEILPYPVIGNGELWTASQAIDLIKSCHLRGVMFGRPAIANPLIFSEFRNLWKNLNPYNNQKKNLTQFMQNMLTSFKNNEKKNQNICGAWKELAFWFSRNPLIGSQFFEKTKRLTTLTECEEILKEYIN